MEKNKKKICKFPSNDILRAILGLEIIFFHSKPDEYTSATNKLWQIL